MMIRHSHLLRKTPVTKWGPRLAQALLLLGTETSDVFSGHEYDFFPPTSSQPPRVSQDVTALGPSLSVQKTFYPKPFFLPFSKSYGNDYK